MCIYIPWAAPWSPLTYSHHFRLSGRAYLNFISSSHANVFPLLLTQRVRISITWAGLSWLTRSCHLWLSGSAYLYFMSSTSMADVFLPLSTLSGCVLSSREQAWIIMAYMFLPSLIIRKCVFIFHQQRHDNGWHVLTCSRHFRLSGSAYLYFMSSTHSDVFLPLSTSSGCVTPFRELHHDHGWHIPATFDSQRVRIPCFVSGTILAYRLWLSGSTYLYLISGTITADVFLSLLTQRVRIPILWAGPSWFRCSRHLWLSGSTYLYIVSNTMITVDMFPPFLINRKCVFIFHEQHNHDWRVTATFDTQRVRIPISWAGSSWLTCFCHFRLLGSAYFISWAAQSWLMYSCHFWLSVGVYSNFLSWTGPSYMFLPSLIIRKYVFLYFMSSTMITAHMFLPLSITRKCVFIFHEQHSFWRVPATFDFQWVRNPIPWAAPCSRLTCYRHFWLSAGAYSHFVSWTIMAYMFLTFWLTGSTYLHFHSSTMIAADVFPPSSIIRMCVFIFHEQQNHGWHVPAATFNSQTVRYSHFIYDTIKADMIHPFPIIRRCIFIFHEQHTRGWHVPAAFDSQRVRIPIS